MNVSIFREVDGEVQDVWWESLKEQRSLKWAPKVLGNLRSLPCKIHCEAKSFEGWIRIARGSYEEVFRGIRGLSGLPNWC
jgi:hypothetical protein